MAQRPPSRRGTPICKGHTVIRQPRNLTDLALRGQPILDEDGRRQYRPCEAYAANGTEYCHSHGGSAPQTINAARRTLALSAERVAQGVVDTALDERIPAVERLKAQVQVLDRVGIRAGLDVGLETPKWQNVLSKMFGRVEEEDELAPTEPVQETPKKASRAPARAKPRKAAPPSTKPKFEGWG